MARPPRVDFPDAVYRVTSRGNGRASVLWTDEDRQPFYAACPPFAIGRALSDLTGRQTGQHYGIGTAAVGATHSRFAIRPDLLKILVVV